MDYPFRLFVSLYFEHERSITTSPPWQEWYIFKLILGLWRRRGGEVCATVNSMRTKKNEGFQGCRQSSDVPGILMCLGCDFYFLSSSFSWVWYYITADPAENNILNQCTLVFSCPIAGLKSFCRIFRWSGCRFKVLQCVDMPRSDWKEEKMKPMCCNVLIRLVWHTVCSN